MSEDASVNGTPGHRGTSVPLRYPSPRSLILYSSDSSDNFRVPLRYSRQEVPIIIFWLD